MTMLAFISRESLIRHERSAVLRLECERRLIPARRPFWQSQRETAENENAGMGWWEAEMEKRTGLEMSDMELWRTHR